MIFHQNCHCVDQKLLDHRVCMNIYTNICTYVYPLTYTYICICKCTCLKNSVRKCIVSYLCVPYMCLVRENDEREHCSRFSAQNLQKKPKQARKFCVAMRSVISPNFFISFFFIFFQDFISSNTLHEGSRVDRVSQASSTWHIEKKEAKKVTNYRIEAPFELFQSFVLFFKFTSLLKYARSPRSLIVILERILKKRSTTKNKQFTPLYYYCTPITLFIIIIIIAITSVIFSYYYYYHYYSYYYLYYYYCRNHYIFFVSFVVI